ncbi:hypothetical protein ACFOSE_03930, partial [Streptococcus dentapri]
AVRAVRALMQIQHNIIVTAAQAQGHSHRLMGRMRLPACINPSLIHPIYCRIHFIFLRFRIKIDSCFSVPMAMFIKTGKLHTSLYQLQDIDKNIKKRLPNWKSSYDLS